MLSSLASLAECIVLPYALLPNKCKCDVIAVVRNVIDLFKLVIRTSPGRNDSTVDTVGDEEVFHKIVKVVEESNTVD
ncbi:hypothetical protein Tco_1535797 [Tanacetum coccineum]